VDFGSKNHQGSVVNGRMNLFFTLSGFHLFMRSSLPESMQKTTHSGFIGYLVRPVWVIAGLTVHGPV
jgi:hypothetical protein